MPERGHSHPAGSAQSSRGNGGDRRFIKPGPARALQPAEGTEPLRERVELDIAVHEHTDIRVPRETSSVWQESGAFASGAFSPFGVPDSQGSGPSTQ